MKKLHYLLISLSLIVVSSLNAAKLSGTIRNAKELSLYYISNFLTGEKITIAQCQVTPEGEYTFDFKSEELRTYYINLGTRRAQITMAPNDTIILDLPEYIALRKSEYLNPYFEQEKILGYDEYVKDINYDVMNIELASNRLLQNTIKSETPSYAALSAIDTLKAIASKSDTDYLKEYAFYNQAIFFQIANPENRQAIKQNFLRDAQPDLQNTAFTELFAAEYYNPFIAVDGLFYSNIRDAIVNEAIGNEFSSTVAKTHRISNPAMAELISVKGFYDAAYYAPNYQRSIVKLMQQLEEQLQDKSIKALCQSSRLKIERLMIGNPAPYFELYTPKGKKVPTVLKRRNVLLAFINTDIYACQKQLHLLENFKQNYKRQLEIVVIAVYQDKKELSRFLERNPFDGLYFTLWDKNEDLLEAYNIKALPTYYLIDKNGKILFSPLSSPEENMDVELQEVFGY